MACQDNGEPMSYSIITYDQRPDFKTEVARLSSMAWPKFMLHGNVNDWNSLFDEFAQYQILFLNQKEQLIAVGHTVPLKWNGSTDDLPPSIDGIVTRSLRELEDNAKPTALSALAIMIRNDCRGHGLSTDMIRAMIALADEYGMKHLLAPLRPTLKSRYPLVPFEEYIYWKRPDGQAFDPWIRVHERMGAEMLTVMPESFEVSGTVGEWEQWTGMPIPGSGEYVMPGALVPVVIDCEKNIGSYIEPNIWLCHKVSASDSDPT